MVVIQVIDTHTVLQPLLHSLCWGCWIRLVPFTHGGKQTPQNVSQISQLPMGGTHRRKLIYCPRTIISFSNDPHMIDWLQWSNFQPGHVGWLNISISHKLGDDWASSSQENVLLHFGTFIVSACKRKRSGSVLHDRKPPYAANRTKQPTRLRLDKICYAMQMLPKQQS